MPRTTIYVIVRYGSNAANQSLCPRAVIGLVEATSQAEAIDRAPAELHETVYHNQYLRAIPWSRASVADIDEANECWALQRELERSEGARA